MTRQPVTRLEQWGDETVEVTYLSGVTHEEWAAAPKGRAFMRRAEMRHRVPACLGDGVCTNPRCATHGMYPQDAK